MQESRSVGKLVRPANNRWTSEQRATALQEYFRTGSRRQVRRLTGVPERTLSVWLTHPKLADERRRRFTHKSMDTTEDIFET